MNYSSTHLYFITLTLVTTCNTVVNIFAAKVKVATRNTAILQCSSQHQSAEGVVGTHVDLFRVHKEWILKCKLPLKLTE